MNSFTNVPVFAHQLPSDLVRGLVGVFAGFGLNLRTSASLEDLQLHLSDVPESLVFLLADETVLQQLKALSEEANGARTLLVLVSEQPLAGPLREECQAFPLVADIWEGPGVLAMANKKCRLYLELLQRRVLLAKEEQMLVEMAYQKDRLLTVLRDGVLMITAEGYLSDLNDFALETLGYGRENLIGAHVSRILCPPDSKDPLLDWCEHPLHTAIVTQQDSSIGDTQFWRSDGAGLPVGCELAVMYPGQAPEYLVVFQDLSIRKAEEQQLNQLTRYDPVTGLASISLLRHFLLKAMARALRNDRRLALLYVDLDDFHCINESFGRSGGDSLLRSVGRRLKNCIRTGDMVSRHQSDAFMIVLDEVRRPNDVEKLARQMLKNLNNPHDLSGVPVVSHASIGIAFYPDGAIGIDELIDQAKEAMEWVKLHGKNGHHVHGSDEFTRKHPNGKLLTH
ncbi:MAG: sensor domain-containing diguanylate cyclase [Ketobacteraceae bacterium]|nr:sensor domain-containing diguanylate cyclase [Ketobacteraceae bacterium]